MDTPGRHDRTDARTAPELTNPRAERVKAVRALSGRSARHRHGQFLVEGPQAVREAVRGHGDRLGGVARVRVRDLYVSPAALDRHGEVAGEATSRGVHVHVGTPEVLDQMSPDAQGILAVADVLEASLAGVLTSGPRLVVVLAHVRDPGNAGTVIRAADAAGADAVVLSEASVDVHNPKVVRATAGSLFHLPVVPGADLDATVGELRAAGMTVLAADGTGSVDLDDLQDAAGRAPAAGGPDLDAPTAWVFGNEAWGLPADVRDLADAVVRVPIHGAAESLNLATAAAVCLYASARAHRRRR